MRVSIARVLTVGFATVLGLAPMVQAGTAPVGTLSGDDKVKLNGKSLTSAQLALPGDIVEAPGAATGTLHLGRNGVARLTAAARASVERSGQEVWVGLQTGYISVGQGDQPMSVRAHGGKITAPAGAVFDVAQIKNTTYITAVRGSAVISDGGLEAPEYVKEGTTVTVAFVDPSMAGAPQSGKSAAATCNDPCTKGSGSKECTDFKALKKKCTPLRKACGSDAKNCPEYGKTCQALAGCKGYGGIQESLAASGAAGAAGASAASSAAAASAASAASAAGAAAGASVAATSAAAAAAAAAGIAGATAAAAGSSTTCVANASTICP